MKKYCNCGSKASNECLRCGEEICEGCTTRRDYHWQTPPRLPKELSRPGMEVQESGSGVVVKNAPYCPDCMEKCYMCVAKASNECLQCGGKICESCTTRLPLEMEVQELGSGGTYCSYCAEDLKFRTSRSCGWFSDRHGETQYRCEGEKVDGICDHYYPEL